VAPLLFSLEYPFSMESEKMRKVAFSAIEQMRLLVLRPPYSSAGYGRAVAVFFRAAVFPREADDRTPAS